MYLSATVVKVLFHRDTSAGVSKWMVDDRKAQRTEIEEAIKISKDGQVGRCLKYLEDVGVECAALPDICPYTQSQGVQLEQQVPIKVTSAVTPNKLGLSMKGLVSDLPGTSTLIVALVCRQALIPST